MRHKIIPCWEECNGHYSYALVSDEFKKLTLVCNQCGDFVFDSICCKYNEMEVEKRFPGHYKGRGYPPYLNLGESKAFTLWSFE